MAIVNGYCSSADLIDRLKATTAANTSPVDDIITAASREVDAICSRRFYKDTVPTARVYRTADSSGISLYIDDVADTSTAVIKRDSGANGIYDITLVPGTDFLWEPWNGKVDGLEGFPAYRLRAVVPYSSMVFPIYGTRPRVQVTALWGWAAVPEPVRQATLLLAAEMYKLREAPFGVAGFSEFGAVRVKEIPHIQRMLGPYARGGGAGLVGIA